MLCRNAQLRNIALSSLVISTVFFFDSDDYWLMNYKWLLQESELMLGQWSCMRLNLISRIPWRSYHHTDINRNTPVGSWLNIFFDKAFSSRGMFENDNARTYVTVDLFSPNNTNIELVATRFNDYLPY